MSNRAMEIVTKVSNQFPIPESTFFRVFGSFQTPHALPKFVTKKLLQEVCYQMTSKISKTLSKAKKKPWPTLLLTIGDYTVKDFKEVEAEAKDIK